MTFAGAIFRPIMLKPPSWFLYRSQNLRFHKFFPNGTGGAHSFKLTQVTALSSSGIRLRQVADQVPASLEVAISTFAKN